MTRIQVVLDLPIEEDVDPPGVEPVPGARQPHAVATGAAHAFDGSIELRAVGYRYPETERWVLRGVDLRVKPGESVALVGRTGAGKTTLLHLVERLFEPTEGVVLLGGIPAAEWPRRALRRSLGIVPQESFLFSDTIRANIGFGFDDGENSPDAEAVARQAGLGSDLSQFPQGLETMIGERGITLSGGQKQRVALARALALKRRALILDDAFASVDPGTEEQILETLFGLPTKPTILLATHRRSALLRVDRVVVLDEGKIVASGTHEELLRAGGLYADLYHEEEVVEELEAL